ncbi:MAG: tRNA (guanosine(46)-N7)-methyltransferase TrmB [Maricaulaceae bacterium]
MTDPDRLRTFGRMQGRSLKPRQQALVDRLLPELSVTLGAPGDLDPSALFPRAQAVWLEVGFGGAEHLLWQAEQNPDIGFIGVEPFLNGVAKAVTGIDARGFDNVRFHRGDARDVLACLAPGSIGRAFVLFPDPWPKTKHHKRRLVNADFVARLADALEDGAELRLASDVASYQCQMLETVRADGRFAWLARAPADWRMRPGDWPQTRYERKCLGDAAPIYLRFRRKARI